MIVELVGGPVDGDRVEVHECATEHVVFTGGSRPPPRWIPGEGFPLHAKVGVTRHTYRMDPDPPVPGDTSRFVFYESKEEES